MRNFVAYHSIEKMGYEYPIGGNLCFYTKKHGVAAGAIDNLVWVIEGIKISGKLTTYALCGVYIVTHVLEKDGFSVLHGVALMEWPDPIELNDLPWFANFLKQSANFSLGFRGVDDPVYVKALHALGGVSLQVILEVENFSLDDYLKAFNAVDMTLVHRDLLRIHSSAPDCTMTARQLAMAMGFPDWRATNLQYGQLASKLCHVLEVNPSTKLSVLVRFSSVYGEEVHLVLRKKVVQALQKIVGIDLYAAPVNEEWPANERLYEGAVRLVQVNAFERNPKARAACIKHYGTKCSVCGFDFVEKYGVVADEYIQVHHLTPIATIGETYQIDPVADLRPVCANCHAVIHLQTPPFTMDEVREFIHRAAS